MSEGEEGPRDPNNGYAVMKCPGCDRSMDSTVTTTEGGRCVWCALKLTRAQLAERDRMLDAMERLNERNARIADNARACVDGFIAALRAPETVAWLRRPEVLEQERDAAIRGDGKG